MQYSLVDYKAWKYINYLCRIGLHEYWYVDADVDDVEDKDMGARGDKIGPCAATERTSWHAESIRRFFRRLVLGCLSPVPVSP